MAFQVCAKQCDQCLFNSNRIVSKARVRQVLKQAECHDSHFVCHKYSRHGADVCCRGFYDANPMKTNLMRIAHRLNMVQFVDDRL